LTRWKSWSPDANEKTGVNLKMHADFPKLFSEISTDGAQRALRWAGVEAFAGIYTKARVEMLARLAFNTKPPAGGHQQEDLATALATFHEAFSETDPSIEQGERQDQILSAATLMHCFATMSTAAMVVTTTACGGARKAQLPVDLVTAAENALSQLAANRRRRPDLKKVKVEAPEIEYELDFSEVQPNTPTTFQSVFDHVANAVDQALADLVAKFNESTALLVDAGKKADEELDMLSWVFGQSALLPNQAFADVPANQKPLVFARDLASLTTIYPGPNSTPALFSRAGVKSTGKLSIIDAVNAVSDGWTAAVLKDCSPSPATTPIHFALAKRQETGAGIGWTAGWSAITGIESGAVLPPITLAELFYREILWLR
jgi:hypothetical protein